MRCSPPEGGKPSRPILATNLNFAPERYAKFEALFFRIGTVANNNTPAGPNENPTPRISWRIEAARTLLADPNASSFSIDAVAQRASYREGQEDQLGALGLVVNLVVLSCASLDFHATEFT
jgi:hypothetical protein